MAAKKNTVTYNGTGRRKTSVARVFMTPGKGSITVNGKTLDEYLNIKEYGYNKFIYNKIEGMSNEKTMGISTEMFFESYLLLR